MTYALHRKLGEEFELAGVRYRIVAALQDSLFQGELIVSEQNFLRLFPDSAGLPLLPLSARRGRRTKWRACWTAALSDYGFESSPPRRAWPVSTRWRTRTFRRSARSAVWG